MSDPRSDPRRRRPGDGPPPDDIDGPVRWVPLRELLDSGRIDELFETMKLALPDLGMAYAIRFAHGEEAADRYLKASGRVRLAPDGEPCVPVKAAPDDDRR